MREQTIYTEQLETRDFDSKGLLSVYANEARTIEGLLTLGYTSSNGVDLQDRLKYLEGRIATLSELLKKSDRRN